MALFKCINHPTLRWGCKDEAVSSYGKYTGARNIFFYGDTAHPEYRTKSAGVECKCPARDLVLVDIYDLIRINNYNKW